MPTFAINDQVIYHQPAASTCPEPGARNISPAERGEMYFYVVDRVLRVVQVNHDGTIDAVDAKGRVTRVKGSDQKVEKVRWWHRLRHRRLFVGM